MLAQQLEIFLQTIVCLIFTNDDCTDALQNSISWDTSKLINHYKFILGRS